MLYEEAEEVCCSQATGSLKGAHSKERYRSSVLQCKLRLDTKHGLLGRGATYHWVSMPCYWFTISVSLAGDARAVPPQDCMSIGRLLVVLLAVKQAPTAQIGSNCSMLQYYSAHRLSRAAQVKRVKQLSRLR